MAILINCSYCDTQIKPHDESNLEVGDIIDCPICAAELEITALDPVQVVYVESEK